MSVYNDIMFSRHQAIGRMSTFLNRYPRRGMDRYGAPAHPPQPRYVASGHTENYAQLAMRMDNIRHLQRSVEAEGYGRVRYETVLQFVDKAIGYYRDRYLNPTYGPTTDAELREALTIINRRVIGEIVRQLRAQQRVQAQWLTLKHHPANAFLGQSKFENDYDKSIESHLF